MANSLILKGDIFTFSGVAAEPEHDLLALEIARAWQKGGIDENLLRLHGLPDGQKECSKGSVEQVFLDIANLVALLGASGSLRKSPQIEALGFTTDSTKPQADLVGAMGVFPLLYKAEPLLRFDGIRFESHIETSFALSAWSYSGVYKIALQNGEVGYGICESSLCGRVFRKHTSKAVYCRDACRVRAAQLRKSATAG